MHILVVEDDQALSRILVKSIEAQDNTVEVVHDGESGLARASTGEHDAVVLDLMLPRLNGLEVCRRLRASGSRVPVLMLTARSSVPERIEGLDVGADDYLVKPFSLGELQARLRAMSRRGTPSRPDVLEAGELSLDADAREVRVGDHPVELTGTEFALLEYLMRNQGAVLSRDQLRHQVWGDGFEPSSNVVDIYVHYVRRKLKTAGLAYDPVRTVRGLGYAFRRSD